MYVVIFIIRFVQKYKRFIYISLVSFDCIHSRIMNSLLQNSVTAGVLDEHTARVTKGILDEYSAKSKGKGNIHKGKGYSRRPKDQVVMESTQSSEEVLFFGGDNRYRVPKGGGKTKSISKGGAKGKSRKEESSAPISKGAGRDDRFSALGAARQIVDASEDQTSPRKNRRKRGSKGRGQETNASMGEDDRFSALGAARQSVDGIREAPAPPQQEGSAASLPAATATGEHPQKPKMARVVNMTTEAAAVKKFVSGLNRVVPGPAEEPPDPNSMTAAEKFAAGLNRVHEAQAPRVPEQRDLNRMAVASKSGLNREKEARVPEQRDPVRAAAAPKFVAGLNRVSEPRAAAPQPVAKEEEVTHCNTKIVPNQIFVSGLSPSCKEVDFFQHFEKFGNVVQCHL